MKKLKLFAAGFRALKVVDGWSEIPYIHIFINKSKLQISYKLTYFARSTSPKQAFSKCPNDDIPYRISHYDRPIFENVFLNILFI